MTISKDNFIKYFLTGSIAGLTSLLIFVSLLEGVLRLAGFAVARNRPQQSLISAPGRIPRPYLIKCMGDSFTFGANVSRDKAYPAYLARFLEEHYPGKFRVVNDGVCECPSDTLRWHMVPAFVQQEKPDMLILLAGSANRFNADHRLSRANRFYRFIYGLRVYKMWRIIRINITRDILSWNARHNFPVKGIDGLVYNRYVVSPTLFPVTVPRENEIPICQRIDTQVSPGKPDSLESAWYSCNKFDFAEALRITGVLQEKGNRSFEVASTRGYALLGSGEVEEARRIFNRLSDDFPGVSAARNETAWFYERFYPDVARSYLNSGRFDRVLDGYCDALRTGYSFRWFPLMQQAFELQSNRSAAEMISCLEAASRVNPGLSGKSNFQNSLFFFRNKNEWEKRIISLLAQDLDDIAEFCRNKGIQLVLMNYPADYPLINAALADAARRNGCLLVDNRTRFAGLLSAGGRWEEYFSEGDHCTPQGYSVMAQDVFDFLKGQGFLPQREKSGESSATERINNL